MAGTVALGAAAVAHTEPPDLPWVAARVDGRGHTSVGAPFTDTAGRWIGAAESDWFRVTR